MNEKIISVSKISDYKSIQIFDILSNPKLHKKIDGSGTII
ncbi:MAG: polyketide cyclase, partial [SAR202 cluster bacterium]|nr:polyketide cyclase [SAR202 cluster bacterium]